jgi:hypothetical protein
VPNPLPVTSRYEITTPVGTTISAGGVTVAGQVVQGFSMAASSVAVVPIPVTPFATPAVITYAGTTAPVVKLIVD